MGLFDFLKKSKPADSGMVHNPYRELATNTLYNLLFCDDLQLYKNSAQPPYAYPYDILFAENPTVSELQSVVEDSNLDPRHKILAYNRQRSMGHRPEKKELLAVIVEVGLDLGLDVLASFPNGSARYINQTGKVLIWENTDDQRSRVLTDDLFAKSQAIVQQIGPWDKPRKAPPSRDFARISFLVSDGLYFGEASSDTLFNDQLGGAALAAATALMQYLTQVDMANSRLSKN